MATLQLEVVTPEKTVVSEEVEMVTCPGTEGEFGVLPHHVSLLSALKIGPLHYKKGTANVTVFVSGGFVDVNGNKCSVLAESAELAENIDIARAKAARERAEQRLANKNETIDDARAEAALQRAIMRLHIAEKTVG